MARVDRSSKKDGKLVENLKPDPVNLAMLNLEGCRCFCQPQEVRRTKFMKESSVLIYGQFVASRRGAQWRAAADPSRCECRKGDFFNEASTLVTGSRSPRASTICLTR